MGAAGPVIIFVMLMVATSVVGLFALAYVSRCVLVVVQETGLGHDEVTWPNEPYQDWLGHAVLFVELLGIWLAPSALAARLLRHVWLVDHGFLRLLLLAVPSLWLFFPIGLLSSLSAQSRWVPFRWAILARFLRIAPAAILYYFFTAILLGIAASPWYAAMVGQGPIMLPVAAAVGGAVILIYARLLGRVALLLQRLPSAPRIAVKTAKRQPAKRERPKTLKSTNKKRRKPSAQVQDPWAIPKEEKLSPKPKRFPWSEEPASQAKPKAGWRPPTPDEIEGYDFAAEKTASEPPEEKPARRPYYPSPEEYEPIDVRAEPEPKAEPEPEKSDPLFAEQVRQRLAERERAELPPPPHPFFSGVYSFPLYSRCVPHWIALSLGLLVWGGLLTALLKLGAEIFGWTI